MNHHNNHDPCDYERSESCVEGGLIEDKWDAATPAAAGNGTTVTTHHHPTHLDNINPTRKKQKNKVHRLHKRTLSTTTNPYQRRGPRGTTQTQIRNIKAPTDRRPYRSRCAKKTGLNYR